MRLQPSLLFIVAEQRQHRVSSQIIQKSEESFFFRGDLASVVETKDVEKEWNPGRQLAAVSGAGLVQTDSRWISAVCE
jgi:hypothetical protein